MPATDHRPDDAAPPTPGRPVGSPTLAPSPCEGILSGLVVRCARGDRASLGTLFDLLHGVVSATVRRRLPAGATEAAAEDAVVEVFHEAWRSAPLFRVGEDDPLLWVLRLAHESARPAPAPGPALVAS